MIRGNYIKILSEKNQSSCCESMCFVTLSFRTLRENLSRSISLISILFLLFILFTLLISGGLEKNKDVESMDKRKMATFKKQATGQHTNLFTLGFDSKVFCRNSKGGLDSWEGLEILKKIINLGDHSKWGRVEKSDEKVRIYPISA